MSKKVQIQVSRTGDTVVFDWAGSMAMAMSCATAMTLCLHVDNMMMLEGPVDTGQVPLAPDGVPEWVQMGAAGELFVMRCSNGLVIPMTKSTAVSLFADVLMLILADDPFDNEVESLLNEPH